LQAEGSIGEVARAFPDCTIDLRIRMIRDRSRRIQDQGIEMGSLREAEEQRGDFSVSLLLRVKQVSYADPVGFPAVRPRVISLEPVNVCR